MRNKGQNLVEFAIIVALVVIAGIVVLTMLGSNVKDMFGKSKTRYETYEPFGGAYKNTGSNSVNNNFSTNGGPSGLKTPSGQDIELNYGADGSVSFDVAGQNVMMPAAMLADLNINIPIESAGSSGGDLVTELAYLVETYKDQYEPEDVPIEVSKAASIREDNKYDIYGNVTSSTKVEQITTILKIDDPNDPNDNVHMVMLQQEGSCMDDKNNACKENEAAKRVADFRFEGDIIDDGGQPVFNGTVERTDEYYKIAQEQEKLDEIIAEHDAKIAEYEAKGDTKKADDERVKKAESITKGQEKIDNAIAKGQENTTADITTNVTLNNGGIYFDIRKSDISGDMRDVKRKDIKSWDIDYNPGDPSYEL